MKKPPKFLQNRNNHKKNGEVFQVFGKTEQSCSGIGKTIGLTFFIDVPRIGEVNPAPCGLE
jgi:hypothetical protein